MTFLVEEDEALDPVKVGLFCSAAEVFETQDIADLIEQSFLGMLISFHISLGLTSYVKVELCIEYYERADWSFSFLALDSPP